MICVVVLGLSCGFVPAKGLLMEQIISFLFLSHSLLSVVSVVLFCFVVSSLSTISFCVPHVLYFLPSSSSFDSRAIS